MENPVGLDRAARGQAFLQESMENPVGLDRAARGQALLQPGCSGPHRQPARLGLV
jgi:hypothetical protein